MQRLEFSSVVRPIYGSLGVKRLIRIYGVPADLSGPAIEGMAVLWLACWDCGLESRIGHGYLSRVCVCVLSSIILCFGLVIRPEESYRVWCF